MEQKILALEQIIKQLSDQIGTLIPSFPARYQNRSIEVKELFTAMAKAQGEMSIAHHNKENPYFKSSYADLAEIVCASRPALTKNGLCVMQQICQKEDGSNILHTILTHSSGQWIESTMRILPSKPDVQSLQSYLTYIKRSAYASLVGVVVSDEDDDAERAVATERETFAKGVALNTKYNPREESYEAISKDQLDEMDYELAGFADVAEQVLEGLKLQNLADMPKSKYHVSMKRIREIKQARGGK